PTLNDSLMVTAIASAQPDSVHGMLPANGTVNLQLPLNLSWIPANPNLYYTYDIYLWKASDSQPSTPYVSGVTNVNYVIPLNAGLVYNTPYKWMVVAHNGSCTQINTGPIQQFTLIPLPDLQVYNVQAPASIFSGQNMTATWSVKNNGSGNTLLNQGWTDAVFISKDSVLDLFNVNGILQFPVVPQLVASVSNPSGLNNGQLYNSSANFTIPINYSGPLYVHVVTNYNPPAVNPVVENNYVNDTTHALPATIVTLSPQPDFQVDTVFTPNNVFSGNTITVSYKVHNHGAAAASGNWVDKIYISKDPLFNPASATLLKFANGFGTYYPAYDAMINRSGALLPDSSYNANAQVVIPNFIYGNYYVYVFTNATGSIYEGANNSNNVNHGPLMQVFLTATPNIVSANVQVPKNASNTQTVAVTWKENNLGANDNLQKNKGHYSASNGTCAVCVSYATDNNGNTYCSKTAIVPNYKDSVGFGGSYWVDQLFLSQDSTFNSNTAAYISNANFGNEFSGYNVNDNIYPSNCGAPLVNQNTFPVLAPNSSFPGVYNYQIPDKLPQGNYYIYVYSNATNSVYQYPGTPSITRSNLFTIAWPDLKVPSVSVPATGNSGQPLTVNYNVQNSGHGGLFNHYRKDYIYLGNNSAFDGTAVLIDSVVYSSATVDTNVVQTLQRQSILPNGISGLKYVFVKVNVDTTFKETSFTNNTNVVGAPVNISLTPSSNFTFNSLSIPNTVYSSTGFPIKYTINNVGAGLASGNWIDSIFISCSSTFNSATAYFVGLRSEQQYIPAGGSYSDSFNLIVPQTYLINNNGCMAQDTLQPYFFVKSNANNNIYQPVKTGNTGTTPQVTFINKTIDLITTSVSGADSALAGRPYKINWSVKNLGLNPNDGTYSSYNDAVWLSPDTVLNNSSLIIGNKNENTRLDRNQSYSDSATFNLGNIPSGYYYLLVKTNPYNQLSGERNINNNLNVKRDVSSVPKKVFVGNPISPDLRDTILSVPSVVAAGQPFTVVYKVTNSGQGATYGTQWSDAVWLSVNFQPSYIFGKNQTRTLAPGQSYIDSVTIILPTNYTPGNYILGVRANYYQQLFESDYSNNTAYNYISVYVPPPVDLIVNNINMADTVVLGNVASVQYQLKNISNNVANGIETDGVYLSADSSLTSDGDILMSTVNNTIKILPLNDTALATALRISGVTEGSYYVKVKADILNNIPETNKDNNTGLMNKKVYVKVKELFMNVPASDTLTGNFLYYKLVVPSAFKGATIMVQLQTPDSVTTANQLYLGLGYVPSAARFDYAFNKPNYGNQQIVIETVLDSVYYIAARGNKPGNGYQLINLSAVALPFTILNVNSNKGGNTGNVTVLLNGSLFRQGMVATLKGAGNNTITASAVYFVNSTSAYATFNLQGAPLGLYDVSLTKPDNSVATLTSGFTVQVTDNGGLLTGGGSNTGQTGNGNTPGCDPGAPSGLNAQLQTEIVIPPKVFVGWPFQMQINFVNTSNVDIPTQVRTLYSVDGAPVGLSQNDLSAGKTTMTIEFKNPNLPGGVIPAGSSGTITIWSKAPANAFAHQKIHFNLK
ncbi:MAG: hypothetical protein JSS98_10595, partial [Bacteroidetes bacterium]|nr:hypothetical protein [Bacteroidota bacterium]